MNAIATAIAALVHARRSGEAAAAVTLPDANAAYAVQDGVAASLAWFGGAAPRYWKSGAPSASALQTHAPLPPEGVWPSPADARAWPFHLRGIEAEIALRLRGEVDADAAARLDADTAAALVDAMCVAIEVVDSRWVEALQAPPLAKLADLQSHGALVLGDWVAWRPCDWSSQVCRVRIGGATATEHRGTHSLGDPLRVLPAWLKHATRGGRRLPAGSVVTTGTWCGLPLAAAGEHVQVEFPGIGRADVHL